MTNYTLLGTLCGPFIPLRSATGNAQAGENALVKAAVAARNCRIMASVCDIDAKYPLVSSATLPVDSLSSYWERLLLG